VTVAASSAKVENFIVTDIAGLYTLNPLSLEEKASAEYILSHKEAVFLQVMECGYVERALKLTAEFIERGIYPVIILTKRKDFLRRGGRIDIDKFSSSLGLPVFFSEDFSLNKIPKAIGRVKTPLRAEGYFKADYAPSAAERLLAKGYISIPFFLAFTAFVFFMCFAPCSPACVIKNFIESGAFALSQSVKEKIPSHFAGGFIGDCLISGFGNLLGFVPQIFFLFAFILLFEESGFMSYAAYALDDFLKIFGLNGRAVFSMITGFGCTAVAVASARGQQSEEMKKRTVAAMQLSPCSARMPVVMILLSSAAERPFIFAACLYSMNIILSVLFASLFKKGEKEELFLELPPLCAPNLYSCLKSLLFQTGRFIIKISTVTLGFMSAAWLLSSFDFSFHICAYGESVLADICREITFIFRPLGVDDWRITFALLSGLAAKENIAGVLAMFYPYGVELSADVLSALSVFVMLCPPCMASFAATAAETSKRFACALFFLQLAFSLAFAAFIRQCFFFKFIAPVALVVIFIIPLGKYSYERILCKRKHNAEDFYR